MATVIDELIVRLGLDPSKFTKGQKEAAAALAKTRAEIKKVGGEAEREVNSLGESVGNLRRAALGFTAALFGAAGITSFVQRVTQADAQLGRFTRTTGQNAERVSIWGNAIQRLGGDAQAFQQSLGSLIGEFEQFSATGQSNLIPFFRGIGVQIAKDNGEMRNFEDILLDLEKRVQTMRPGQAKWWLRNLGIDEGTINAILTGKLRQFLSEQERIQKVTKEHTDAAEALASAWDTAAQSAIDLGRTVMTSLTPSLIQSLETTKGWIATAKGAWQELMEWMKNGTWGQVWEDVKKRAVQEWATFRKQMSEQSLIQIVPGSAADNSTVMKWWRNDQEQRALAERQRQSGAPAPPSMRGAPVIKPGAGVQSPAVKSLAEELYAKVPEINRFTAFDDAYHRHPLLGYKSKHATGHALDFTIKGGKEEAAKVAQQIRDILKAQGVNATVRDEYNFPSRGSTGNHIHVEFKSAEEAAKYLGRPSAAVPPTLPPTGAGAAPSASPAAGQQSSTTISIQTVTVNTQATDADGIARDMIAAVQRQTLVNQANYGVA